MPTFRIRDGVRRAKAMQLMGRDRITADVYSGDKWIASEDIVLADLLSPKDVLDLTDARSLIRFRRLESLILAGVILDAIQVVPSTRGTPIALVQVLL